MSVWMSWGLLWAAAVLAVLRLVSINGEDEMTEDAVTRAIQSAAREAFAMGMRAREMRGSDQQRMKEKAVGYAQDLVLPMVGQAIQEALEAQWIEDHGRRHSAPDITI